MFRIRIYIVTMLFFRTWVFGAKGIYSSFSSIFFFTNFLSYFPKICVQFLGTRYLIFSKNFCKKNTNLWLLLRLLHISEQKFEYKNIISKLYEISPKNLIQIVNFSYEKWNFIGFNNCKWPQTRRFFSNIKKEKNTCSASSIKPHLLYSFFNVR